MTPERLRQIDIDHNTRVLSAMTDGQTYKTWCYIAQGWAIVKRIDGALLVKMPGTRKKIAMTIADAAIAIVNAHQGN